MQELLFHYHRGNNFIKTYSEFRDEIKMKEKLSNRRYRWWKQAEGEASDLERRNDSAVTQMRRNETWCNNSEEKKKTQGLFSFGESRVFVFRSRFDVWDWTQPSSSSLQAVTQTWFYTNSPKHECKGMQQHPPPRATNPEEKSQRSQLCISEQIKARHGHH